MMKKRKLGIIGGSGLYKMEGFEKTKWKKINTPWGKPSDEILLERLLLVNADAYLSPALLGKNFIFDLNIFATSIIE